MYIMYHLLRAAGPPLPQNIMAFSNQIDFETDPQGKRTLIFQATSAIFVQDHHSTQGDLTQIFPTFPNAIVNLDFHMKTDTGLSWVSNDR